MLGELKMRAFYFSDDNARWLWGGLPVSLLAEADGPLDPG